MEHRLQVTVDGRSRTVDVDSRVTVLDLLRERLGVISPKKGCDHGQCGSCTVLIDGRRVLSCLTLALSVEGSTVVTADGLRDGAEDLHPLQQAFVDNDAYQCGYCTPGQICSAVGMLAEVRGGSPSSATADLAADRVELDDAEIRERMSGNLCRCGAYVNIVAAIREWAQGARPDGGAR